MKLETSSILCATCNTAINEPINTRLDRRSPCPKCGSISRKFVKDELGGQLVLVGNLKVRGFRSGFKRWFIEITKGADISARLGRWMRKFRLIDRDNNRYAETVIDPMTGEMLHHVDEPLSNHTGHGSAKKP